MPWIKAKKYKYPNRKTLYNPKTKMYRHGTGKQPQGKDPEFVRGNLSRRQEKGEDEYTEEDWKYILFDHLASCEIDLPTSWTLGKNDPEPNCIDYKKYDIYGQKRKKPVSKKKADAEFAAGEIKYYGKQISSKQKTQKKSNGFSLGWV